MDEGVSTTVGPAEPSWTHALPERIVAALQEYRTCEFSTLARDGAPVTWPTTPLFQPDEGRFIVGTSIGLYRKARNVRRDPHVAMLFSSRTGTLGDLPAILVQGLATCPEELYVSGPLIRSYWRAITRAQRVPFWVHLAQRRLAWYHTRLFVFVRPTRIRWWDADGVTHEMAMTEAGDVA